MSERPVVPRFESRTYYDQPVLKPPVWTWEVPTYFFTGGLAAGAALLGTGGALTGNEVLERRMHQAALAATAVSGGLLVSDLGVPTRFHHMLRVAKPTSPMSVGSWALGAFAATVGGAALGATTGRFRRVGRISGVKAAVIAPVIATYTAVLVANTAVPVWHDARRSLPYLFASGAAASAGALGAVLVPGAAGAPARRLALGGALTELAASQVVERRLDPAVGRALREPRVRGLRRAAAGATAAGAALLAVGRGRRRPTVAGALAVLAGAVLERFAVVESGRVSAADPHATVAPQRARLA